jgi:hypothetical protein
MNVGDLFDILAEKLKTGEFSRIDEIDVHGYEVSGIDKVSGVLVRISIDEDFPDCSDCFEVGEEEGVEMKWTPCAAELPDADETVLTYAPDSLETVWPGYYNGESWVDLNDILMQLDVTHWMPFPEPPAT